MSSAWGAFVQALRANLTPYVRTLRGPADAELLDEIFVIDEVDGPLPPARYNIALTDLWLRWSSGCARTPSTRSPRKLVPLRWGLVPSWSKDASGGGAPDQRPVRDGGRETGVSQGAGSPALSVARRRLLRVVRAGC